ncbi:MAG: hypothetical protein CL933_07695, partial [Deltaproteobacteria bacterium]|nr:hypothetical protein [Deltaproteobacteria bacterium]
MDDPVPIPPLLEERPGKSGRTATGSPIHLFDPVSQSTPSFPEFEGVRLYHDLFTESEAARLIDTIDAIPFIPAQSGKGKQHYGPRINFNKRKMKAEAFHGIPAYARDIESRMRTRIREDRSLTPREHRAIDSALTTFETTDVFVLRYRPEQSSNLDFHLDDPFAYGELIADLSLQSDAVLTFLR